MHQSYRLKDSILRAHLRKASECASPTKYTPRANQREGKEKKEADFKLPLQNKVLPQEGEVAPGVFLTVSVPQGR